MHKYEIIIWINIPFLVGEFILALTYLRQEVMFNWYREELYLFSGELISEWEKK